jgi:hypothetical protein
MALGEVVLRRSVPRLLKEIPMAAVPWFQRFAWVVSLSLLAVPFGCGGSDRTFVGGGSGGSGTGGTNTVGPGGRGTGGSGTSTGGSGGIDRDSGPDTTPPTIQGTAPANAAMNIPIATTLSVDFSEPMAKSSVMLTVMPAITLNAGVWNASGTSVAFTPSAPLAISTTYNVTVAGADVAGNALTGPSAFSFTTEAAPDTTPPTIVSTVPANNAMNIAVDSRISVTFSEAMDEGSVSIATVPDVALGTATFNAQKTQVSYTPPAPFGTSTEYTVTVKGQDPAHNALAGTTQFKFTTASPPDTTPPRVVSVTPVNNATNVANNTSIIITFTEAMNQTATAAAISLSPAVTCTGGWTWNTGGTVATCVPTADLPSTTLYTVGVSVAAKDLAGNAMTAPFSSNFTTGVAPDRTPPTIVSVTPASNTTGVIRTTSIAVTFSEAMDVASSQSAFSVTMPAGVTGTFTWTNANKVMTFKPTAQFAYGDVVRFQVSTAAKDAAGNAKATNDVYQFTVVRSATVNCACIDALDGFVNSLPVAYPAGSLTAGDSGAGGTLRAYEAFDLSAVPPEATAITAAYIYANQYSTYGTPYGAALLGDLLWDHVNFGPTLESTDYGTPLLVHSYNEGTLSSTAVLEWKSSSVLFAVLDDWTNKATRGNRSEYVFKFTKDLINNGSADYAYLYPCSTATATLRPYLTVTYEYP